MRLVGEHGPKLAGLSLSLFIGSGLLIGHALQTEKPDTTFAASCDSIDAFWLISEDVTRTGYQNAINKGECAAVYESMHWVASEVIGRIATNGSFAIICDMRNPAILRVYFSGVDEAGYVKLDGLADSQVSSDAFAQIPPC